MFRRTRVVETRTKEDWKEQRQAEDREFADMNPPEFKAPADGPEPEFDSIEAFAEFLYENDLETYTFEELNKLRASGACRGLKVTPKDALASYGLKLAYRPPEKEVRGYTAFSSPYAGNPMAGGSGVDPHGGGGRFNQS